MDASVRIEKGCGDRILVYRKVTLPGEWDWKIKTRYEHSGLYQLPPKEYWLLD